VPGAILPAVNVLALYVLASLQVIVLLALSVSKAHLATVASPAPLVMVDIYLAYTPAAKPTTAMPKMANAATIVFFLFVILPPLIPHF
jgi:hypothetical protein